MDRDFIDNWVLETFPNSDISDDTFYIMDGIFLNSDSLDYFLSAYKTKDILGIDYLDSTISNRLTFCKPNNGIILILTFDRQKKSSAKRIFKEVKSKYSRVDLTTTTDIDVSKGEPVLILNDSQVYFKDCYDILNKDLHISQIKGIHFINSPVNESIYGANAVNGLVIIKTKTKI